MSAKTENNGRLATWECGKHPEAAVKLYGLPSASIWCYCGKKMKQHSMRESAVRKNAK